MVRPGGSSFGPFIVANLLKRSFRVEADLTSNSSDWNLELDLFLRACFLLRCEDQKRAPSWSTGGWFVTRKAPCYLWERCRTLIASWATRLPNRSKAVWRSGTWKPREDMTLFVVFFCGPCPFHFFALLVCWMAKRKSGWRICVLPFLCSFCVLFWFYDLPWYCRGPSIAAMFWTLFSALF